VSLTRPTPTNLKPSNSSASSSPATRRGTVAASAGRHVDEAKVGDLDLGIDRQRDAGQLRGSASGCPARCPGLRRARCTPPLGDATASTRLRSSGLPVAAPSFRPPDPAAVLARAKPPPCSASVPGDEQHVRQGGAGDDHVVAIVGDGRAVRSSPECETAQHPDERRAAPGRGGRSPRCSSSFRERPDDAA